MQKARQIIALGGGGFSDEPDSLILDEYILKSAPVERPRICFIPTASNDAKEYIENFYRFFEKLNCEPAHLSLAAPPVKKHLLEQFVLGFDILYVGGGNTRYMLSRWEASGLDKIIAKAYTQGIILAGISAGAICWFQQGLTDSIPGKMTAMNCMGILKGSASPHYNGEKDRRPSFNRLIQAGELLPGYGIDDGCALHFVNEQLHKIVSSHAKASAYFVEVNGNGVSENAINM